MEKHALLSASSASKWLNCTPSARLEEKADNKTSKYMAEGTLAHAIAEFKVKTYFFDALPKRKYNSELKKFEKDENYNSEMLGHTETYLEYIKSIALQYKVAPFVSIEKKVDYGKYAKDGFGTADCLIMGGDTLHVIDFKYGKGVEVSAEENPQMKLYALGAYEELKLFYVIENVVLTIIQPRLDNISEYKLKIEDLLKWGSEVVKPKADLAFAGLGDATPGEYCRFCRVKGSCKARADKNLKAVKKVKEATNLLANTELGALLVEAADVTTWIKDLQAEALDRALQGESIPGWKVVEGRSNRVITDVDALFSKLQENEVEEALLYKRQPLTLTELEKLVGKAKFTELASGYVEKPKGAPTLVVETDKRPIYKIGTSAEEDFAE